MRIRFWQRKPAMTNVPQWALDLVSLVAADEQRKDIPDIVWRRKKKAMSSGICYPKRIVISAGSRKYQANIPYRVTRNGPWRTVGIRDDQRLTLLHELAHWLSPIGEHHGPQFWDKAWEMFRRYNVPILYAKVREGNYRKGAIAAYKRTR